MNTIRKFKNHYKQRGISLIELMVSEVISLLIISGLLIFVVSSVSAVNYVKKQSEIHDNGVFAYTQLHEALLNAGYQGCDPGSTFTSNIDVMNPNISPRLRSWAYHPFSIMGFDANEDARFESQIGAAVQSLRYQFNQNHIGDILAVQYPRGPNLILTEHNPTNLELTFRGDLREKLHSGQIIQLNDCSHAARVQINPLQPVVYSADNNTTTVSYESESSINCANHTYSSSTLSLGPESTGACSARNVLESSNPFQFSPTTRGHIVSSQIYYVGYDADQTIPALKRSGFATNAQNVYTETLVEGIENIRIRFGIDTSNDGLPDIYHNAAEVTQMNTSVDHNIWENIVNLKIWLLVRSSKADKRAALDGSLPFPSIDGTIMDCMSSQPENREEDTNYLHACPFVNSNEVQQARRVVTFSIAIPNNQP